MTIQKFIDTIWKYYKENKRDLPWRNTEEPYLILVSEMMLQQTQVSRVLIKYKEFTDSFPTFKSLAEASMSDVLRVWKGLGYNRRAYFLKQIAEVVINEHKGVFPSKYKEMLKLPGIGQSTAGALSAFSFHTKEPFIETNIRSVYMHEFFKNTASVSDKDIIEKIGKTLDLIDSKDIKDFYYALYDYGSMLKQSLGKQRLTLHQKSTHYKKQSKFEGSKRQLRSIILDQILNSKKATKESVSKNVENQIKNGSLPFIWNEETENLIVQILTDLQKKNQIVLTKNVFHIS